MDWGGILKMIGGFGAAPFTGGATAGFGLSGLSDVLGGMAKSGAANNISRDSLTIADERNRLDRDKFAVAAPGTRMDQSMKASLASNYTPQQLHWEGPGSGLQGKIPTYTGGMTGAMANLDPNTKALMAQVMKDNLLSQMSGGASAAGGGTDRKMSAPVNQSSGLDKVVGGAAMGTSLLSAIMKLFQGRNGGGGGSSYPGMINGGGAG